MCAARQNSPELAELSAGPHGDRLICLSFDVRDSLAIREAAKAVTAPLDAIVYSAAIYGSRSVNLRGEDIAGILEALDINALGALRVVDSFLDRMFAAARPRIVAISSLIGSFSKPGKASYAYAVSKAAMNKAMQLIGAEVAERRIAVACMRPGWVRTKMGGDNALMSPDESAAAILAVVDGLMPSQRTVFLDIDGQTLPW